MLLKPSKCNKLLIIERLSLELKIKCFQFLQVIRTNMTLDDSNVARLRDFEHISGIHLLDFVFAVGVGNIRPTSLAKQHRFASLSEFAIQCDDAFRQVLALHSLRINLFCKAANDSFGFTEIHSMFLPRYLLSSGYPTVITESVDIPPCDEHSGHRGDLLIKCSSEVTISVLTTISGAGNIRIISSGTFTNQGTLRCNGMNDGRDGDIYIVSDMFWNTGTVQSGATGSVFVFCSKFINTGDISPAPKIFCGDSYISDFFIHSLFVKTNRIEDVNVFYNELGVSFDSVWIPYIVEHQLLWERTNYNNRTVIERLYDELAISFFRSVDDIRATAAVDHENILTLNSPRKLVPVASSFAIAMGQDLRQDSQRYETVNVSNLTIPCDSVLTSTTSSLEVNVFCKAIDDSFDFALIHSTVLPRYEFKDDVPVTIKSSLRIPSFDEGRGQKGTLLIRCSSDFTIGPGTVFDGNGVMPDSSGGIIRIISSGTVTNKGTLCCNGLNGGRGGIMYVVADTFANEGKIECGPNGRVFVFCTKFVCCDQIESVPIINVSGNDEFLEDDNGADLNAIDYMMHSLQTKKQQIENVEWFYSEIGVKFDAQWFPVVQTHDLLNAPTRYEGRTVLYRLSNELKIEFFRSIRTWRGIVHALNQELYPGISSALGRSVDEAVSENNLSLTDLTQNAFDKVMGIMKNKRNLTHREITYIRELSTRDATKLEYYTTTNYAGREFEDDLSPHWKGLNMKMVVDVYGVHKAMKYGMHQRETYRKSDFMADIKRAECSILDEDCVSKRLRKLDIDATVSFQPEYVIEDDMFETVNCLLALSVMVNRLRDDVRVQNEFRVKCVVVPKAVTSIYEPTRTYRRQIDEITSFLHKEKPIPVQIEHITDILTDLVTSAMATASSHLTPSYCIIIDRNVLEKEGLVRTHIFNCNDWSNLSQLDRNYNLGMEFEMTPRKVIRCHLTFGMAQRVRFFPEQLVWILPSLFRRSSTMTAYAFLKKMYGAKYKWGWSVSLRDESFETYHHILTGKVHCSVNYNPEEVTDSMIEDNKDLYEGLRDHLERAVDAALMQKLKVLLSMDSVNGYDSDALAEDVLDLTKASWTDKVKEEDSNMINALENEEFKLVQSEVMAYRGSHKTMDKEKGNNTAVSVIELQRIESANRDSSAHLPSTDFGISVLRWLSFGERANFESLKNDLLKNAAASLNFDNFERFLQESATDLATCNFNLPEAMALKVFGVDALRAELARSHCQSASGDQRKSFYNWALALYRVHLKHAVPIPPAFGSSETPSNLYAGKDRLFTIDHEVGPYYGSWSTTVHKNIANTISTGKGLRYTFQSSYLNPFRFCIGIGTECEGELMLYHQFLPLSSTEIFAKNELVLHFFLHSLWRKAVGILHPAVFYKQVGFKWEEGWIPSIMSHKLLFQQTPHCGMTVMDRLAIELGISYFKFLMKIRNSLAIGADCIFLSEMPVHDERDVKLADFVFAVSLGDRLPSKAKEFNFRKLEQFIIPLHALNRSAVKSLNLHLFCKADNGSFDFVSIYSTMLPRHYFKQDTAVTVTESVTFPPFNEKRGQNGSLLIKCFSESDDSASDFIIGPNVIIDGGGLLLNVVVEAMDELTHRRPKLLEFRDQVIDYFKRNSDILDHHLTAKDLANRLSAHCGSKKVKKFTKALMRIISEKLEISKGRVIRIIASGTVTNKGTLRCIGWNSGRGGDIYIVADSFVNEGKVECGPNGRIFVFCSEFANRGEMYPGPVINGPGIDVYKAWLDDWNAHELSSIEYLMHSLLNKEEMIAKAEDFYIEIGVQSKEELYELMDDHEHALLNAVSRFDGKTVSQRLAEELHLEYFMD